LRIVVDIQFDLFPARGLVFVFLGAFLNGCSPSFDSLRISHAFPPVKSRGIISLRHSSKTSRLPPFAVLLGGIFVTIDLFLREDILFYDVSTPPLSVRTGRIPLLLRLFDEIESAPLYLLGAVEIMGVSVLVPSGYRGTLHGKASF